MPLRSLNSALWLLVLCACGGAAEQPTRADAGAEEPVVPDASAQQLALFGRDALGRAYAASPSLPADYAALERWLKLGRACDDPSSKRIYLVEEKQTRPHGVVVSTSEVVPRVVVAGCAGGPLARAEVMAAIVTDPASEPSDPLQRERVELIALDDESGLYNFYELFFEAPTRVVRAAAGASCFSCHVNGGPIMNELSSPWLGWVSEARTHPLRTYAGLTAELAREADRSDDERGSLAYDLERGVRAGIERFVSGAGDGAKGFARSVADGTLPGGARRLLSSVFCQTELNHHPFPLALFVDPDATDGAELRGPSAPSSASLPRLVPTRSHFDRAVEQWLVGQGYLRPQTVLAVRLFDHLHDIFSESRCALLASMPPSLPAEPGELDARVCELLADAWRLLPASPQRAYAEASCTSADASEARGAYQAALAEELARAATALTTHEGVRVLEARASKRVVRARAMFLGPASPLPRADR